MNVHNKAFSFIYIDETFTRHYVHFHPQSLSLTRLQLNPNAQGSCQLKPVRLPPHLAIAQHLNHSFTYLLLAYIWVSPSTPIHPLLPQSFSASITLPSVWHFNSMSQRTMASHIPIFLFIRGSGNQSSSPHLKDVHSECFAWQFAEIYIKKCWGHTLRCLLTV